MSEDSSPQSPGMPEQRGDFMLLPPMSPTFGVPKRIQQSPSSFLVTRRPTALTTDGLAHAVDPTFTGRVSGRVRRASRRMRTASSPLDHLIDPLGEDVEEELPTEVADLPAPTKPRSLNAASITTSARRTPRSDLPTRSQVRSAVSAPPPASRSPQQATESEEPPALPDSAITELPSSTFPNLATSTPVVRRRPTPPVAAPPSRVENEIPLPEPEPASSPTPAPLFEDGAEPSAIIRRKPRGRVHQPPE